MNDTLGLYLSIPFCRGKCTFCNFASDAFSPGQLPAYLAVLHAEIAAAWGRARQMGACLPEQVDTIYVGGGTPSLLNAEQLRELFAVLRSEFRVLPDAEITMECAPGQLVAETLAAFQAAGGNRISFGVQSFVDAETMAVGRQHNAATCRAEIDRVRTAGVRNISVDLIAGLPLQTRDSWRSSLAELVGSGVDHASVYLFEVDEESRLGREVLAGGDRMNAQSVPDDDETAEMYTEACEVLAAGGLTQYEISNFACEGRRSRHNVKYWQRRPYLGFGLDAHSMLQSTDGVDLRFANTDELESYLARGNVKSPLRVFHDGGYEGEIRRVTTAEALEEFIFLGLRMNEGVLLGDVARLTSVDRLRWVVGQLSEAENEGLVSRERDRFRLTARGRLLSNEVFGRLLRSDATAA